MLMANKWIYEVGDWIVMISWTFSFSRKTINSWPKTISFFSHCLHTWRATQTPPTQAFWLHADDDDSLVLHSFYFYPTTESIPPPVLSVCELAKIFLTSEFSYLLFFRNPTHITEMSTLNWWGTPNSKPPGLIMMIGQSKTGTILYRCSQYVNLPKYFSHLSLVIYFFFRNPTHITEMRWGL
jgi:hypothetical protein